jgi:hypothetical protein
MHSGVIEGFYGPPWSWDARVGVLEELASHAQNWYVWAPKSDRLHRRDWREPFGDEHLNGFDRLTRVEGASIGVAIGPGLSMDTESSDDRALLLAKCRQAVNAGARLIMLAFDDIPYSANSGDRHGRLARWLFDQLVEYSVRLVVVPTEYAGVDASPYLGELAAAMPPEVLVAWSGRHVVSHTISVRDAERFREAVGGRLLVLWDNYPVNDALLADRLFLHDVRRDPLLVEHCALMLANGGLQPYATVAAVCGNDVVERYGLNRLRECCDDMYAYELTNDALGRRDFRELTAWFRAVQAMSVASIVTEEVEPWVTQAKTEASLGLAAIELIEADFGSAHAIGALLTLMLRWPAVRRASVTVMGPRFSLAPVLAFGPEGSWSLGDGTISEGLNAIDMLCRCAVGRHTAQNKE